MTFNKQRYIERFIKSPSAPCANKQQESAILQAKVDDFVAAGGKIKVAAFGQSNFVSRDLKEQVRVSKERMKND